MIETIIPVKKRIIIVLLCMLPLIAIRAQVNLLPAYYISNQGDTVSGFIENQHWIKNPDQIEFRRTKDSESLTLFPGDIREFALSDLEYISATVMLETSSLYLLDLKPDSTLHLICQRVFLQTLVKGDKSLYSYLSSDGRINYYIWKDGKPELLVYKEYLTEDADIEAGINFEDFRTYNYSFRKQLSAYLGPGSSLVKKCNSAAYNKADLIRLFNQYYSGNKDNLEFSREYEKLELELGVFAGPNYSFLKFSGYNHPELIYGDFSHECTYTAGISAEVILSEVGKRFTLNNEFYIRNYKSNATYLDYINEDYYFYYESAFDYTYLRFASMFRYRYNMEDLSLFCGIGLSVGYSIKYNSTLYTYTHFYFDDREKYTIAVVDPTKVNFGKLLGAGVEYKHFSVEARFEITNGMSSYAILSSKVYMLQLLAGYKF